MQDQPNGAPGATHSTDDESVSFLIKPEHADAVADQLRSTISGEANELDGAALSMPLAELSVKVERMAVALRALEAIGRTDTVELVEMPRVSALELAEGLIDHARDLCLAEYEPERVQGFAKFAAGAQLLEDLGGGGRPLTGSNRAAVTA